MPHGQSKAAQLVAEFHRFVGADVRRTPTVDVAGGSQRCDFLEEEVAELRSAVVQRDVVSVADALADILYVTYGTALHFGIDLDAAFREVHRSNMSKTPAGNGKATKGTHYSPPCLAGVISAKDAS